MLSLLNIRSNAATAFGAFTALSSLGLYTSYIIVMGCLIYARLTGRLGDRGGAITFGRWRMWKGYGLAINLIALVWTIYLTIWLPFPATLPVTGTNMNYAGPIYLAVLAFCLILWYLRGRTQWNDTNGLDDKVVAEIRES